MNQSLPFKIVRFTAALAKFIIKGKGKFLSESKMQVRLEICKICANFTGNYCKACGCKCGNKRKFMNKLVYPTEDCPEGRWSSELPTRA
jgi:hypothetical protein